ncbi:MAG: hypothetical protein E7423_00205 [Ruminococcaceae bacterium]|jgi:hypothetical protein|nr:hypothetical protein [Oscillospiraceae bacterium]
MPGEYDSMARAFMGTPQGARIIGFLDQLNRLMQGPEGRELLSLLGGSGGEALKRAAQSAAVSGRDPARALLSGLLSSPEGTALVAKIIELSGV